MGRRKTEAPVVDLTSDRPDVTHQCLVGCAGVKCEPILQEDPMELLSPDLPRASKRKRRPPGKRTEGESSPSTPPEKPVRRPSKKRKASDDKTKEEKRVDGSGRTVRFLMKPSVKTKERIERAEPDSRHRLFLIDRKKLGDQDCATDMVEEFAVLGATGNGVFLGC